jgi:predicted nuclease of restriction endonuclease-like (RecB) superfamily
MAGRFFAVLDAMKNKSIDTQEKKDTGDLYTRIRDVLESSRARAYQAVNTSMIQAYWNIGRLIVEEEQKGKARAGYGEELIKGLSVKLQKDYGKCFTTTNLKYFRQFYLSFPIGHAVRDQLGKIWRPVSAKLTWTHYRLLLKVKSPDIRDFYFKECIENNWSTRQLERQINSFYYQRLLSSKNKSLIRKNSKESEAGPNPLDIIKDPYVLEFLSIPDKNDFLEQDLEKALLNKLQNFMLELGKGFSFVARQKRLTLDGDHFYVDLVFYNYILKCFVLIDLKVGKLTHHDIGQMDFYVRYFEKEIKQETDNPTIGIILCSEKNNTMVKYSMLEENKKLFASKYMLYLPSEEDIKQEIDREKKHIELEYKK